jgi:spore coat protein U-like protein
MKKLNLILAGLALAGAATTSMAAGTAVSNFDVTVTFTGSCSVKTAATAMTFTYAAFDTAKSGSTSTVFKCSRGLTPTFAFDNTIGTSNGAQALATALTGEGVISGIRYVLGGTSSRSTSGTAASAGAGGTGGSDGTADEYTVAITADIAAGQAGTGTGGSAVTQTRTLTIAY